MSDELFLIDDTQKEEDTSPKVKILIVDDELAVHTITNASLQNKNFEGKRLEILTAMSGIEAREILKEHDDIALALIDVVMETPNAGLELVEHIRNELNNKMIRLVLRTGQPSQAPEEHVINFYDINDYKEKTELTAQKLYTLVRTSIKQYGQYKDLQDSKDVLYTKMTTSELTGLPNRMKLNESLDSEGRKSLILINIDAFTNINETHGFEVGDELLKVFARYLDTKYKGKMQVFHLNVDVFALLCYNLSEKNVQTCMSDLKEGVSNHEFKVKHNVFTLSISIGIVLQENGNLIQKAEFAIKEARNVGKSNPQIYREDLNIVRTIHANSLWTQRLHLALEENRVFAYFQAIQNIKTQKIEKYEALVRLEYAGEVYLPAHFLHAAIYSGHIYEIFMIMFRSVCEKAQENSFDFSVNISEYDLKEANFIPFIKDTLQTYNIEASRICLEILEYKSLSKEDNIKDILKELHDLGLKLSIDDFGLHCSNFSLLNNLSIDYIKIDEKFIKDIVRNKDSQVVSHTIIDYAHQRNIPVIAEFVCDEEIYNYIKEMGVEYAQGYFIGKPSNTLS